MEEKEKTSWVQRKDFNFFTETANMLCEVVAVHNRDSHKYLKKLLFLLQKPKAKHLFLSACKIIDIFNRSCFG